MAEMQRFATAFLCERILREEEGVCSAIRIVDLFRIPHDAPPEPEVIFWAYFSFKVVPVPDTEFNVAPWIVGPTGKRARLEAKEVERQRIQPYGGDPTIPAGLTVVFAIGLKVLNFGTGFIEFEVNGIVEARTPFTLIRLPSPAQ